MQALTQSHKSVTRLDVLENNITIATLDLAIEGTVTAENSTIRRHADVVVVDADGTLTPDDAKDLLVPYGNEIRPWRGIDYQDGSSPELVPLGTMLMTTVEIEWPRITIRAFDRMFLVQVARFWTPYVIPAGTLYENAIQDLIDSRLPPDFAEFNFPSSGEVTPAIAYEMQADPAQQTVALAAAIGNQIYPNQMGVFSMTPEPDPSIEEVIQSYVEGPDSVLLSAFRGFETDATYNGVVATGENSSAAPVTRGEAWDLNTASPTYRYGKFGQRPRFFSSPLLASDTQALKAAEKLLKQQLGLTENVRFVGVVNPAHEVSDVVYIERPNARIQSYYVLDQITTPLQAAQPLNATARSTQIVLLS